MAKRQVDASPSPRRQGNLDSFLQPVKKPCTEVDPEASALYNCNLCHRGFRCTQGLGSHMATAHREKDKEAGGKHAPEYGPANWPLAPEVALYEHTGIVP